MVAVFEMVALTADAAMKTMEVRMLKAEATRLRAPMMRVPVFREMHAQQFGSFGRQGRIGQGGAGIFVKKYLKT